jgi:hypothetical protein
MALSLLPVILGREGKEPKGEFMTVKYEDLMNRRKEASKKLSDMINEEKLTSLRPETSTIEELRNQIREIDRYVLKYYSDKVVTL